MKENHRVWQWKTNFWLNNFIIHITAPRTHAFDNRKYKKNGQIKSHTLRIVASAMQWKEIESEALKCSLDFTSMKHFFVFLCLYSCFLLVLWTHTHKIHTLSRSRFIWLVAKRSVSFMGTNSTFGYTTNSIKNFAGISTTYFDRLSMRIQIGVTTHK